MFQLLPVIKADSFAWILTEEWTYRLSSGVLDIFWNKTNGKKIHSKQNLTRAERAKIFLIYIRKITIFLTKIVTKKTKNVWNGGIYKRESKVKVMLTFLTRILYSTNLCDFSQNKLKRVIVFTRVSSRVFGIAMQFVNLLT